MILNSEQIEAAGIVTGGAATSRRATTYDATIGDIVSQGELWEQDTFVLEKRGIVWVVSSEEFSFDEAKTGLATLRTTWTHRGVLALNVGIIDPGWKGPLATALVNFSGGKVSIKKGDSFFRVLVFSHKKTAPNPVVKLRPKYLREIMDLSRHFALTFLDTDSLVDEVAIKVFKIPKLAVWIGWSGLGVALASIFAPLAINVWQDHRKESVERAVLERRVADLESRSGVATSMPTTPVRPTDVRASGATLSNAATSQHQ